jgi:c-di-GMP-binding flagellar brake protein YcgR
VKRNTQKKLSILNSAHHSLNRRQEATAMTVERRKNRRFHVKDKCFAVINPDPVKLVPIIDISQGGLGFYLNDNEDWLNKTSKLEIMVADCSFYMDKLPFHVVSSSRALPNQSTSLLDGRRYSLKFGHLQPNQRAQLRYFIRNYSEGGYILQFQQKVSKLLRPIWSNQHTSDSCKPGIWQSLHRSSL